MINRLTEKIAGNYNEKQLKQLDPIVRQINDIYEHEYADYDQKAVQTKTQELKDRVASGEDLDDILPEAYALVKRACALMVGNEYDVKGTPQTWNMIPYDVQLLGGIVLHRKTIAEMKTGEGKTLVAALPLYLNALTGKGAHLVTVNDYLASRDAVWMGYLYEFLGLTIGSVTKSTPQGASRRKEYESDITYIENSELGFDYLRDNLAKSMEQRVLLWRPLHFAIVDEIDSILIDEARTPLIISQPADESTDKYTYYAKIVRNLTPAPWRKKVSKWFLHDLLNDDKKESDSEPHGDYYINEKTKNATLTSEGIAKLEKILSVENLYRDIGFDEIHHIENAIKAQAVYRRDKEYIVTDGEVVIVDINTGRAMPGRRFNQWLHQAIEAKEWVAIQRESKTIATVTYQNFFKQYEKLAGMTGTATTEGEEFSSIYELDVLAIRTNKPVIRVDYDDKVFFSQKAKWKAVMDQVQFSHQMGQPILVGTSSIHTSELVSSLLKKAAIKHSVLNAKFHEQEANIVAGAGKKWSVVVATNMAGRGTDIKLPTDLNTDIAANHASRAATQIKKGHPVSLVLFSADEVDWTIDALAQQWDIALDEIRTAERNHTMTHDGVEWTFTFNTKKKKASDPLLEITLKPVWSTKDLIQKNIHYGLMILATEKHDSRRIDNQLRGRAGRQGDAGVSMFFVALDDEIMRKVWGEKIQSLAATLMSRDQLEQMELTNKQFGSSIIRAQKQMEARHFSSRKHLFDYDTVVDKQRQTMYNRRNKLLEALKQAEEQTEETTIHVVDSPIIQDIRARIPGVVGAFVTEQEQLEASDDDILQTIQKEFNLTLDELPASSNDVIELLTDHLTNKLDIQQDIPSVIINKLITTTNLNIIDHYWIDHIDVMQHVRDKVGLMSYAQIDPLVQYKKEAYELFQQLQSNIDRDIVMRTAQIDRDNVSDQMQARQAKQHQKKSDILSSLKAAAASSPKQSSQPSPSKTLIQSDEDGVEVIEMGDQSLSTEGAWWVVDLSSNKIRPNDRITIRHTDGKVEYDVKYKKVKNLIEAGKAEIVG